MQWGQTKETLLCVLKLVALTPLNFFTRTSGMCQSWHVFFVDHLFKGRFLLFQCTFGLFLPCSVVRHVVVSAWIVPGFAASHFGDFHSFFCHMFGIVRLVYT